MTKSRNRDGDNPVQLFPFVAVLLCTMGALLVLLVSVARTSRARALEETVALQAEARAEAALRAAESRQNLEASRRELDEIAAYQSELDEARRRADAILEHDRARLAHLEDHMRRLREQLEAMKLAAAELNSMKDSRFDDRQQAEAEVERLRQLIAEARKKIEELRAEAAQRAKSYAIVPFEGRNGTRRRPIYIECDETGVILQPEGVAFTMDDFRPPIGPGNPLVAALRAAREHVDRSSPAGAQRQDVEPYPLIVVRPKGFKFYRLVREAIQSWDSEFGYELVEQDWKLTFGGADPQLANVEYDAAQMARERLRALADAAPQAYGAYRGGGGWGDGFGYGDGDLTVDENAAAGERGGGDASGGVEAVEHSMGIVRGSESRHNSGRIAAVIVRRDDAAGADGAAAGDGKPSGNSNENRQAANGSKTAEKQSTTGPATATAMANGPQSSSSPGSPPADGSPANGTYVGGYNPEAELDRMARNAAANEKDAARKSQQKTRGKNWAIRNANPGMIPIRRTIQILIRVDALVIQPEAAGAAGQEFAFGTAPNAAYDDLLSAVDKRIADWGMAGQGLYWRPVIELRVAPDGDGRADQLVRLLEHGGAEVRSDAMAQQPAGGTHGATQ
ncbi:MAG: hypothetical protein AB7I57_08855 [Pirellulales bacterium]